ncbi:unnamed protein product [Cercopithifilaria johnstoni]|uniref:Uncharacterized protein n=1 Tax=Cercopithifilaria johnstoni TaxID=2874296 RepID=A0A8J2Q830_9BILA|nr:unnamed protein product [Cercopithifilaria johnstoni]
MLIYLLFVWPYRFLINPFYRHRPFASHIVKSYIQSRKYPTWTSFFLLYRDVQDDNFGDKHFNFNVDGHNYCILRQLLYENGIELPMSLLSMHMIDLRYESDKSNQAAIMCINIIAVLRRQNQFLDMSSVTAAIYKL